MKSNDLKTIWDTSGLPEYYSRMDELKELGLTFDAAGELDNNQSVALAAWLELIGKSVTEVTIDEIKSAIPSVAKCAAMIELGRITTQEQAINLFKFEKLLFSAVVEIAYDKWCKQQANKTYQLDTSAAELCDKCDRVYDEMLNDNDNENSSEDKQEGPSPDAEEVKRRACNVVEMSNDALRLYFGEMSAQEIRTVRAVLRSILQ